MIDDKSRLCPALRNLSFAFIALSVFILLSFFICGNAYALDKNYIIDEYEWFDIDDSEIYNQSVDGFSGKLKQLTDEDNGCFYLYFSFSDKRLSGISDDAIVLSFTVKNSANTYRFSVNRKGFVDTGQDDIDAIKLIYNFDYCSSNYMGGEIMVGFELNKETDRMLKNTITCNYSAGLESTNILFENYVLDMYVEPTEKETTTKKNKHKITTTKAKTTKSSEKKTTKKSSKKETTTKFVGSGRPISTTSSNKQLTTQAPAVTEAAANQNTPSVVRLGMSSFSIGVLVLSIVLALAGIIILTICATDSAIMKKLKKEQIDEDKKSASD